MKWYIEFPIVWAIVFVVFFLITPYRHEDVGLGIFISLVIGTFISAVGYAGYCETKKKQKIQSASEEERIKIMKKEQKMNKIMILIIILLIILCVCMIALVTLI